MRLLLGSLARATLVLTVIAVVALFVRLQSKGLLSPARLQGELSRISERLAEMTWLPAPFLLVGVGGALAIGLILGWLLAVWWIGRQLRSRSLLLVDLRHPDMPFVEGVRHVRAHAGLLSRSDQEAASLLVIELGRGRLSLWRRTSSDLLRRVPPRQLSRRLAVQVGGSQRKLPDLDFLSDFTLLREEVERLWPKALLIEGTARTAVRTRV